MSTYTFQLVYFPGNYSSERGLFHGPRVYIGLKAHGTVKWPCDRGGESEVTVISQSCASQVELCCAIDRLIDELQTLKRKGEKLGQKDERVRKQMRKK